MEKKVEWYPEEREAWRPTERTEPDWATIEAVERHLQRLDKKGLLWIQSLVTRMLDERSLFDSPNSGETPELLD